MNGNEPSLSEIVGRLSRQAASKSDELSDCAAITGAVPVYADAGGVLLITPDGGVVQYDPETGGVVPVRDGPWRTLALVKAARKFPELAGLGPRRPETAVECSACRGSGVIVGDLDCATCSGTGWTAA